MAEPAWLTEARKLEGLRETPGEQHNPEVVKLFAEAGHSWVKDDETAWCAAFACAMLERAGVASPRTLRARDFLEWGDPLEHPVPGCVVVFKRGNNPEQGHIAFYLCDAGSGIQVLGGNQRDAVNTKIFHRDAVLGYRWPADHSSRRAEQVAKAVREPAMEILQLGSKGWRVRQLQDRLRELNYTQVGKVDGDFGTSTRAAILDLQANEGLVTDGKVGPKTWVALDRGIPRPVGQARATATAEELAETSRIAGEAARARRDAALTVCGTAATGGVAIADKVSEATDKVERMSDTAEKGLDLFERLTGGALSTEILIGIGIACVVVFAVVMWRRSGRIIEARLDDHRTGRTG